jgi:hypothetical protein
VSKTCEKSFGFNELDRENDESAASFLFGLISKAQRVATNKKKREN